MPVFTNEDKNVPGIGQKRIKDSCYRESEGLKEATVYDLLNAGTAPLLYLPTSCLWL
jgi:hypothetical protein